MTTRDVSLARRRLLQSLAALGFISCFSRFSDAISASPKDTRMSRIFITGSTDGLGLAAARTLMDEGHEVVLHARSKQRASVFADLAPRPAGIVIGDLSSASETRSIAGQLNEIGRMDAV